MKSIQDVIRQKELELQKALEDAVRAKEVELVRLRKTLQEALTTIDHLLEDGNETAGSSTTSPKPFAVPREGNRPPKPNGTTGGSEFP